MAPLNLDNLPAHRSALREILERDGIRNALMYLNGLTAHRFTALYRFSNDTLKKSYFYDRLNPDSDICADLPIEASYCVFIKNSGQPFSTENSLADERVVGHPKQKDVLSYCGVPLIDSDGKMFGSVCHFDFEAMPMEDYMVVLMEELATLIMETPRLVEACKAG